MNQMFNDMEIEKKEDNVKKKLNGAESRLFKIVLCIGLIILVISIGSAFSQTPLPPPRPTPPPINKGSLKVTISPQAAIDAGAKWRVDGGAWHDSGATQTGLSVGTYTVDFKTISEWNIPSNKSVTITSGQTTTASGTYTQQKSADISLTKNVNNFTPHVDTTVTFTITATNNGPSDATAIQITDQLPTGFTYVSDDSGGSYISATGLWNIGALANGSSSTLNITTMVDKTGAITNTATKTASSPTDDNAANDADSIIIDPIFESQIISLKPVILKATMGSSLKITVNYDVSDKDNTLSALGIRIHFDSTRLKYNNFEDLFETNKLADPQLQNDVNNEDNNDNTDKTIVLSYTKVLNESWRNEPLPLELVTFVFTVKNDAPEGSTNINVTKVTGHAGYGFVGNGCSVNITYVHSIHDGDVAPLGSRDGIVNVGDALIALRFALGLETISAEDKRHGDIAPLDDHGQPNPDGEITVGDALIILRKALRIIAF